LDRYLAVGDNRTIQRGSDTGVTWTAATNVTAILGGTDLISCCWSEEQQLFFVASSGSVWKSADGLVWSSATGTPSPGNVKHIVALPEHLAVYRGANLQPGHVTLYRYSEMDGTTTTVVNQSLVNADLTGMEVQCAVRLASTSAHPGRILVSGEAGLCWLSGWVG
jgi:hypothetical protein